MHIKLGSECQVAPSGEGPLAVVVPGVCSQFCASVQCRLQVVAVAPRLAQVNGSHFEECKPPAKKDLRVNCFVMISFLGLTSESHGANRLTREVRYRAKWPKSPSGLSLLIAKRYPKVAQRWRARRCVMGFGRAWEGAAKVTRMVCSSLHVGNVHSRQVVFCACCASGVWHRHPFDSSALCAL